MYDRVHAVISASTSLSAYSQIVSLTPLLGTSRQPTLASTGPSAVRIVRYMHGAPFGLIHLNASLPSAHSCRHSHHSPQDSLKCFPSRRLHIQGRPFEKGLGRSRAGYWRTLQHPAGCASDLAAENTPKTLDQANMPRPLRLQREHLAVQEHNLPVAWKTVCTLDRSSPKASVLNGRGCRIFDRRDCTQMSERTW